MLQGVEPLPRSEGSRAEDLVRRLESIIFDRGADQSPRLGSKEELRKAFQVALGTMNEAVRVLETRGLIELRRGPQGGVFVAPRSATLRLSQLVLGVKQSKTKVEHCLAVRNQIEPLTIVEAAKVGRTKTAAVEELYEVLGKMISTASDPEISLRWNWHLHRKIAQMGENTILTAIYLSLLDIIEAEVVVVAPARSYVHASRIHDMHKDIVDAIASGDLRRSAEAAKRHPLPLEEAVPAERAPRNVERASSHGR